MSEKPNDSPAFRLRPRSEPKSYYTIRLEYSANPAAFTRERPRSSLAQRRTTSTKGPYSKLKQKSTTSGNKTASNNNNNNNNSSSSRDRHEAAVLKSAHAMSKEDLEREERRKRLRRHISQSITTSNMISPFVQRLELESLKASSLYEQNYVTLKIERVTRVKQQAPSPGPPGDPIVSKAGPYLYDGKHIVCRCSGTDSSTKNVHLDVHLYNEFAREDLLKVNKIMSLAKFRTGPACETYNVKSTDGDSAAGDDSERVRINFAVIVRYDDDLEQSSGRPSSKKPLIPYVCITDMIEEPTDPYVDMPLPSPPHGKSTEAPHEIASGTNCCKIHSALEFD